MNESKIYSELDKHIKNINFSIRNEFDTYSIYADYEYAHCKIDLNYDWLAKDFNNYLKSVAEQIVRMISYEYFYTREYKERR